MRLKPNRVSRQALDKSLLPGHGVISIDVTLSSRESPARQGPQLRGARSKLLQEQDLVESPMRDCKLSWHLRTRVRHVRCRMFWIMYSNCLSAKAT